VKNPRKGSTKRQDSRFAQPQAARRASARDGAREPPLSPPYFKRMPERKFRHFFCLLHRQRGREEPSQGVDKTAGQQDSRNRAVNARKTLYLIASAALMV